MKTDIAKHEIRNKILLGKCDIVNTEMMYPSKKEASEFLLKQHLTSLHKIDSFNMVSVFNSLFVSLLSLVIQTYA